MKKTENNKWWQGCREVENLIDCWWGCKIVATVENGIVPQKVKHRITTWPNNSTRRYIYKRNESKCSYTNLYTNVYNSIIHNSPKQKNPNVHKAWMDK